MGLGLKEMPPPGADRRSQGQRAEIWVVSGIQETWSCDTMSQKDACCIDRGPKGNIYRVHEPPQTLEYVKRLNYP